MSIRQADEVAARIRMLDLPMNGRWNGLPAAVGGPPLPSIELRGGIKLTLLSPRTEDLARLAAYWEKSLKTAHEPADADQASPGADEARETKASVYVVSAPEDERWRGQLQQVLASLLLPGRIVWSTNMAAGKLAATEEFRQWRRSAIEHARVGVVLVSPDALVSDWVQEDISELVTAAAESQLALAWILVRPAPWHGTPLAEYQALGNPTKALSEQPKAKATQQLAEIAHQIADLASKRTATPKASARRQRADDDGPIDVEKLVSVPFVADRSVVNNASIAFLAEYDDKSLLICGDASPDVLAESIRALIHQRGARRLRVDAMVVPHGGSAHNLHRELLELLDCNRYLIATSGERFRHPHRETIARILAFGRTDPGVPLTLVFNYRAPTTAVWDDPELQERWNYRAIYPQHEGGGIKVQI